MSDKNLPTRYQSSPFVKGLAKRFTSARKRASNLSSELSDERSGMAVVKAAPLTAAGAGGAALLDHVAGSRDNAYMQPSLPAGAAALAAGAVTGNRSIARIGLGMIDGYVYGVVRDMAEDKISFRLTGDSEPQE